MSIKNLQGFTLVEILVSVVLVSFSLLSIAALQFKTLQFNRSATYQSQATIIAHDMIERMRANSVGVKNGSYHLPTATTHSSCFTSSGCTVTEMAENDMYEWAGAGHGSVSKLLPSGVATVCIDSTPDDGVINSGVLEPDCDNVGSIYAIKILWKNSMNKAEESNESTPTQEQYQLPCSTDKELVARDVIDENLNVSCFVTSVVL